jgi:hypothetical protein
MLDPFKHYRLPLEAGLACPLGELGENDRLVGIAVVCVTTNQHIWNGCFFRIILKPRRCRPTLSVRHCLLQRLLLSWPDSFPVIESPAYHAHVEGGLLDPRPRAKRAILFVEEGGSSFFNSKFPHVFKWQTIEAQSIYQSANHTPVSHHFHQIGFGYERAGTPVGCRQKILANGASVITKIRACQRRKIAQREFANLGTNLLVGCCRVPICGHTTVGRLLYSS